MNRQEAIAAGAKTYDPARPCTRGHMAPRYVLSGACLECLAEDKAARNVVKAEATTSFAVKCHPDDAQVLASIAQHLAALRRTGPLPIAVAGNTPNLLAAIDSDSNSA